MPNMSTPQSSSSLLPLFLCLDPDGSLKMGTCEHCVVEQGRPKRAWDANGDADLDFDRDRFLAEMKTLGVEIEILQEYICP
jgi:hypothetical protein